MGAWFSPGHLEAEWRVLTGAPILSLGLLAAGAVMAYLAARWRFSGKIEHLEERIRLREDRIADYEEKLKGASPEEAKARLDSLESAVTALRPRRLTEEQRRTLAAHVRNRRGRIEIAQDMAVADARLLTADLVSAFREAGWEVRSPSVLGPAAQPITGLGLSISKDAPELQQTVAEALRAAGIQFDAVSEMPPSELVDVMLLVTVRIA